MGLLSRHKATSEIDNLVSAAKGMSKKFTASGLEVSVEIDGAVEFRRNIDMLYDNLEDFSYILDLIEDDYYSKIAEVFDKEGRVDGRKRWTSLSNMYRLAKEAEYPNAKILERTGALRDSFCEKGSSHHFYMRTPNKLAIGSKLKTSDGKYYLGKLHQSGYTRPAIVPVQAKMLRWAGPGGNPIFAKKAKAVKVPARPITFMSEKQKDIWAKAFHREFAQVWKPA